MTIAFSVQDDDGQVAGANSYLSVADLKAYWANRNSPLTSGTADLQAALINARDYLDSMFRWKGVRTNETGQTTQWPRDGVTDLDGFDVTGIPQTVKDAAAELAKRSLSAELLPDVSGDIYKAGAAVVKASSKVGPIEESVEYDLSRSQTQRYAKVDAMLRASGLLLNNGRRSTVRN